MKILLVTNGTLPVYSYGGTERVVWYLGKSLARLGHEVCFLADKGFGCDFGKIINKNPTIEVVDQIPKGFDLVHFHYEPKNLEKLNIPYLITKHGNGGTRVSLNPNTIFVSKNHAKRHNSNAFVYNGLDWSDYDAPSLNAKRSYFHFLGKAAWRVKNVKGAINSVCKIKEEKIHILGGSRLNFNMGFRFTWQPRAKFFGMVGGKEKLTQLQHSKGLVFPVRWHEPFGLAIIESLYFGAPIFGTPYGSLPELVNEDLGYLSKSCSELSEAIKDYNSYDPKKCNDYAATYFSAETMATSYLKFYETILNGKKINPNKPERVANNEPKFLDWLN
jgi:glycosyltransferase involved in cell wall biosynthesis